MGTTNLGVKRRRKKVNNVKKHHLWPSFVLLGLGIVFGAFSVAGLQGEITGYVLQGKILDEYDNGNLVKKYYEKEYEKSNDVETAFNNTVEALLEEEDSAVLYEVSGVGAVAEELYSDISSLGELEGMETFQKLNEFAEKYSDVDIDLDDVEYDTLYVYGKESNEVKPVSLARFGEVTGGSFWFDDGSDLFVIEKDGDVAPNYWKLLLAIPFERFGSISLENANSPLITVPIWIGYTVDGGSLALKRSISLTMGDILFFLGTLLIGIFIFILPVSLMVINIIINASHRSRIIKVLHLDTVTGGYNWTYFNFEAPKFIRRRRSSYTAIVSIAYPKYRSYVVCNGIDEADKLLESINKEFRKYFGKNTIFCHYANSDFGLVISGKTEEELVEYTKKALDTVSEKFTDKRIKFAAGMYILKPATTREERKLRRDIDVNDIYNGAATVRVALPDLPENQVVVYTTEMAEELKWENEVEANMDKALENKEFLVYLQSKYNPETEVLSGAEALIRWQREDGSLVAPYKFIPLFEKNGFITKIDDYMISNVARLQAEWHNKGYKCVPVSVNVSRAHFTDPNLAEHICGLVDQYECPHNLVEIELTESAFFDDKKMLLNTVLKLKDLGFEVSMDDFGAGYSSLNSLKDLPLDVLKLDADFFRGDSDERGQIVVSEAIKLAKSLDMRIVAEGIEEKAQVEFLRDQGCDMIQGYYYAKPEPVDVYVKRAFNVEPDADSEPEA